jgi:hypothetical protein
MNALGRFTQPIFGLLGGSKGCAFNPGGWHLFLIVMGLDPSATPVHNTLAYLMVVLTVAPSVQFEGILQHLQDILSLFN